jgi:hypothetical protein
MTTLCQIGPVSIERHARPCTCNHCTERRYHAPGSLGLTLPLDKAANAWRSLYLVRPDSIVYTRWTGFWKRMRAAR